MLIERIPDEAIIVLALALAVASAAMLIGPDVALGYVETVATFVIGTIRTLWLLIVISARTLTGGIL